MGDMAGFAEMMTSLMSSMNGDEEVPPGLAEMLANMASMPGMPGFPTPRQDIPTGPIDKETKVKLRRQVASLFAPAVSTKQKVETLHELNDSCGFGELQREFLGVNGVAKLVEIATSDWPADGDLSRTGSPYDVVVTCDQDISPLQHAEDFKKAMKSGASTRKSSHSMRRVAICCLGDMSTYKLLAEAMEEAQFFTTQNLGRMLEHTLKRYRYGQTYRQLYDSPDQGQCMAERLACIAANASFTLPTLRTFLLQHCAISMARHYVTPKEVAVNRRQAAREAKKAERASKGLPPQEDGFDSDDDRDGLENRQPSTGTTVPYQWSRFWSNALQRATAAEMEALIEEGLMAKLRASLEEAAIQGSPLSIAIHVLEPHYKRLSRQRAREARAVIQETEAEAMDLRLKGNAAFKQGKWQEAVEHYTEALSANWEDVALWNNRSLAFMKLNQIEDALQDAKCALGIEPANMKAWARLGDSYMKLGRKQLAQLCYKQATELAPGDAQCEERLKEALAQVSRPWKIDDIPTIHEDFLGYRKWLKLPPPSMKAVGRGRNKRMVPDVEAEKELLSKACSTERAMAANHVKDLVSRARVAVHCGANSRAGEAQTTAQVIKKLPKYSSWCVSWSDTPVKQKGDGLICFTVSVADQSNGMHVYNGMTVGEPKAKVLLNALRQACLQPMAHGDDTVKPYRPKDVFVAARMLPYYDILEDELAKWGVSITLETYEEAVLTCRDHDTDPDGYNFRGQYVEDDGEERFDL